MTLGEFLRSRRERLTPEDVGLTAYGRRRTPGLRREEVAQLAHIGASWYTALEQDRSVNPSEDVLDSIATALRFNEDERRHLQLLARPVKYEKRDVQLMNTGLERTIMALDPNPAFAIGRCWDLLMWNKAAEVVFRLSPFATCAEPRPNWMRHLLSNDVLSSDIKDWEAKMQVLIARFRADFAYFPEDEGFKELIEEFMGTSRLFREIWPLHDVQAVTNHRKRSYEPRIGEMEFEYLTLQPPANPELKMMIFAASPATAERLRNFLSTQEQ